MPLTLSKVRWISCSLLLSLVCGCYHAPYNDFEPDSRGIRQGTAGGVTGLAVGALATGTLSGTLMGGAIGGTIGTVHGLYKDSKPNLIKQLRKQDIDYIQYGDTMTLYIPTDKYFMFMSPRLNELCYAGLANVIKLLKLYPASPIYVAGFTDNVGTVRNQKRMSQAQAETILSFLWANGIKSARLKAEGYGSKHAIADNRIIHGSAHNRRIEIQWFNGFIPQEEAVVMDMK